MDIVVWRSQTGQQCVRLLARSIRLVSGWSRAPQVSCCVKMLSRTSLSKPRTACQSCVFGTRQIDICQLHVSSNAPRCSLSISRAIRWRRPVCVAQNETPSSNSSRLCQGQVPAMAYGRGSNNLVSARKVFVAQEHPQDPLERCQYVGRRGHR